MAANPLLATPLPAHTAQREKHARDAHAGMVSAPLSRLRALHDEAEETARLANLLGRTLYASVALTLGTALALAFATTGLAREAGYGVLMLLAVGAALHAYRHTMAAPFERAALRSFSEDLNAIILYSGFAWGAGAFLAFGVAANPLASVVYSAGMIAVLAVVLRSVTPVLHFAMPAAALCAASLLLGGHGLAAVAVLASCAAVAAVSWGFDPHRNRVGRGPAPAGISLA